MKGKFWSYLAVFCSAGFMAGCLQDGDRTLAPAGFENVTVGGELGDRLSRNFDRMETELYQPEQVYWTEQESGGWPGDKEGRTILALVLDGRASHREPKYLGELIRLLPEHLNAKGYLGSIHEGEVDEQQLSGHGWLLRGLCEYYAWKQDPQALEIARTIVDSLFVPIAPFVDKYPLSDKERIAGTGDMSGSVQNTVGGWRLSSDIGCVFIGMEGLIHSYQYVPSEQSKALIEKLIALFERMDLVGIKAQTHASLTAMRGMLRYAALTGDTTLIPKVETRWKLYKEFGMTENYENYNWFERYDTWTEPCAIIDSYLVATQLWAVTRNPQYLFDISLSSMTYKLTAINKVSYTGLNDDWSLTEMTAGDTPGVYTATVTKSANTPWGVKIVLNDNWDLFFGGNGTPGELVLYHDGFEGDNELENGTYTLTVDLAKGTYSYSK